jgi:hypothetical protein
MASSMSPRGASGRIICRNNAGCPPAPTISAMPHTRVSHP